MTKLTVPFLNLANTTKNDLRGHVTENSFYYFHCFSDGVDAVNGKQCLYICFHNSASVSAAYFYAGNSKVPSASGFKINDERGS